MDRNQFIGLILIAVLLFVYATYFAPEPYQGSEQTEAPAEVISTPNTGSIASVPMMEQGNDSIRRAQAAMKFGAFSVAMEGSKQTFRLENEDIVFEISTKGGEIVKASLKEYNTFIGEPVDLAGENNNFAITLPTQGGPLDLRELYFDAQPIQKTEDGGSRLVLVAQMGAGKKLEQIFTLSPTGYVLNKSMRFTGLENDLKGDKLDINWEHTLIRLEEDVNLSRQRSGFTFLTSTGSFNEIAPTSGTKEEKVDNFRWFGNKYRFFTAALIFEEGLQNGVFISDATSTSDEIIKQNQFTAQIPIASLQEHDLAFYFGPNSYKVMKRVTDGFEQNVYLGYVLVSWVNKWIIINVFYFLEQYISNYGLIIILLVLLIKLVLFPLSYKSYLSMAKMKVLKPEMDEIKERVGDDMQKLQSEQMQLYQKVGVNPLSGCIPLLLQMPILFAMFFFFPNSIELRQQGFLWAHDLSTYDVFFKLPFTIPFYGGHVSLFTLLMTASTILYTWSNNQVSTVTGPMKQLGYVMPLVFMVVLNSFPAGLSFYYFVSNIVTFSQQAIIRRFVDDEKIRAILDENKKRNANKKKSKFQQKLEDALRASEEAKKKQNPGKKN